MIDKRISLLLRWYRKHGRDLPWRKTRDPYRIFISEIMLQQTQVSRVIDFYDRWIKRFPDWKALACAKTDALIRAWSGLGYNRRALYAREAARSVVKDGIPRTIDGWRGLKGVGPYAAAAIFAFTEHRPAAAIDTNIRRVIGRAYVGTPHPEPPEDSKVSRILHRSLTRPAHYEALYALMDLGALVCTSKKPNCTECPLRIHCKASSRFLKQSIVKKPLKKKERVHEGKRFPDRIYRGRMLKLVRAKGIVHLKEIGPCIDESFERSKDERWMRLIAERMVRDGLLQRRQKKFSLPKT